MMEGRTRPCRLHQGQGARVCEGVFWVSVMSGTLYVVATPIGNLSDIGGRALEVLGGVDLIAAEDTRHSGRLLQHYHISTPCVPYHDHNEARVVDRLIGTLREGRSIALISDAGTPGISDPGYRLTRAAHEAGIPVVPVAGPSAFVAALSASGLATDRFCFEGFLPAREAARRRRLEALADEDRTLVFYVPPRQVVDVLDDLGRAFGDQRRACIARELSKRFETIRTATLGELRAWVGGDPDQRRGEFVVCVEGRPEPDEAADDVERLLAALLTELPVSRAVAVARRLTGLGRNRLYSMAMRLDEGRGRE